VAQAVKPAEPRVISAFLSLESAALYPDFRAQRNVETTLDTARKTARATGYCPLPHRRPYAQLSRDRRERLIHP